MSHIWVPKISILEAELDARKSRVCGEYTIKKYKLGHDEPVQVVGPFSNLITDWGMEAIGTASVYSSYIYIGTGTSPATTTDTQLAGFVARTDVDGGYVRSNDPTNTTFWGQGTITKVFMPGMAVGTFTEVGLGNNGALPPSPTYKLFSRALIVDGTGNPVSITVLADEYLNVSYTFRVYPPLGDSTQTVDISGTTYTFNTRPINYPSSVVVDATTVNFRSGFSGLGGGGPASVASGTAAGTPPALAAITASAMLTPGQESAGTVIGGTYLGSYSRSVSLKWDLGQGNLPYGIRGGIFYHAYTGSMMQAATQATISPAIMKINTQVLTFGFTYSYARYTP